MKHLSKTIPDLIQIAKLAEIRAVVSCDVVQFLDSKDKRRARKQVSNFRYVIREIKEVIAYLQQELGYLEKEVEDAYKSIQQ